MLEIRDLRFRYSPSQEPVLRGASLKLERGSLWCLAGANGAGKSTLARLCSGMLTQNSAERGAIFWNNEDVVGWSPRRFASKIAFVPGQHISEFSPLVREFVLQGRFLRSPLWSSPSVDDQRAADSALKTTGAIDFADTPMSALSTGQLQLCLIARAICQETEALLLDESLANLDLAYQVRVLELLRSLHEKGKTALVVAHDLSLVLEYIPNLAWLHGGAILASGPTSDVFTSELAQRAYELDRIETGKNPLTGKPKLFLSSR